MDNKVTIKYLIGTFTLSYLMWGIIIVANQFGYLKYGTPVSLILFVIGGNAPPLVAYVVLKREQRIKGFKQFISAAFAVKQKSKHYALVLLFLALYYGIPGLMQGVTLHTKLYVGLLSILPMIFLGGLEELGWRYILQPALEKRFPFVAATSITAVIWSIWHLPLFYISGTGQYNWNFGLFSLMVFGLAFALAALLRISKSIWLCILLHSSINGMLSSWYVEDSFPIRAVTALALIIFSTALIIYKSSSLSLLQTPQTPS